MACNFSLNTTLRTFWDYTTLSRHKFVCLSVTLLLPPHLPLPLQQHYISCTLFYLHIIRFLSIPYISSPLFLHLSLHHHPQPLPLTVPPSPTPTPHCTTIPNPYPSLYHHPQPLPLTVPPSPLLPLTTSTSPSLPPHHHSLSPPPHTHYTTIPSPTPHSTTIPPHHPVHPISPRAPLFCRIPPCNHWVIAPLLLQVPLLLCLHKSEIENICYK